MLTSYRGKLEHVNNYATGAIKANCICWPIVCIPYTETRLAERLLKIMFWLIISSTMLRDRFMLCLFSRWRNSYRNGTIKFETPIERISNLAYDTQSGIQIGGRCRWSQKELFVDNRDIDVLFLSIDCKKHSHDALWEFSRATVQSWLKFLALFNAL